MDNFCYACEKEITSDEKGLHKKLMGRASERFMCITCLAKEFKVSEELLREKIKEFKEMGCTLFL